MSSQAADERGPGLAVTLEESRYDRQERVTWWDQDRLRAARVLVVGAGALGNEVVKNLVLVGVGDIVVIDLDVVEASNLARCVFYRPEDEGLPKATTLARRAGEVNSDVTVSGIVGDVHRFGTGIARRADVIVGALDNREARLYCNRLAARVGATWVDGAIEALNGVARVFSPPDSCYECTFTEADWEALAHRQSCRLLSLDDLVAGKVPTTATTSSIVAGIEAQEVVKVLHAGRDAVKVLSGALVIDGTNNDTYPITYPTDPDCLAHHHLGEPSRLEAGPGAVTVRVLAEAAWGADLAGATAEQPLVIDLGDDHVTGWECPACGARAADGRPAALVVTGDAVCPECGDNRVPELTTSLPVPSDLDTSTLASMGVRTDEILAVRRGSEERSVWLCAPDPDLPASWEPIR